MALTQSNVIANEDVISQFQSAVIDRILAGVSHAGNPPMCRGFQCVPTAEMDHIANVKKIPDIGDDGTIANAARLIAALISITNNLTRVGTYSFTLQYKTTNSGHDRRGNEIPYSVSYSTRDTKSGKVLLSNAHIRSIGTPANANTVYGETITATNINQLFANIYQTWASANKDHMSNSAIMCHTSCHENCHSNCHTVCHSECHGWTIIKDCSSDICHINS